MKEFIDKLIERLEEEQKEAQRDGSLSFAMGFKSAKLIAIELAEEYNNGWIPCSERLPERNKNVLCWAKSTARGGDACFVGSCDNGFWFLQIAVGTLSYPTQYEVVAWCELPAPYTEGE